ncbi:AMP-dependent synthetase/ligase [Bdellovibrio sp. HCB337]|uniref:AMP-dependent synthetase/ligase n=1 Tax=Bdellovibrio sp. HCB337 TaxID=3394358 RepID=UPI0039A60568
MENLAQIDIYSFLKAVSEKHGDKPALFGRHSGPQGDQWSSLSFNAIRNSAETLAAKLLSLGLEKGDRVLLLAKSRPEYAIGFFAIPLAGGVIVPVDIRLNLNDQKFISEFSEAKFILCMNDETRATAERIAQESNQKPVLVQIEAAGTESVSQNIDFKKTVRAEHETFLMAFTSGTTSQPKAAMLSFHNVYIQVAAVGKLYHSMGEYRLLSILPLHHMFEITAGFLLPFSRGGRVYYANSLIPHQIISFFRDLKIRNLLAVPLFLRTLKKGIESEIQHSKLKRIWFYTSLAIARYLPFQALRRLLFYPLHKKFGGQFQVVISGASALDQTVGAFFDNLGISVYEGYGMTETAPIITANSPGAKKSGSIGKVLDGVEVRLHPETQEILVRGPIVMSGYFKNPEATKACLSEDGWFNTGDVGSMDEDGFYSIQGRNKDLIVLGNGKKVMPEEVEQSFRDLPNIQEICVLGMKSTHGATKGTEIVTAVVVLNEADLANHEQIQKRLHDATLQLSYYKRPTKFIFLTEPLPKTTTLKIKKNLVKELLIEQRIKV